MEACRLCGAASPAELVDLGGVPSIHLLYRDKRAVPQFPLRVYLCGTCGLAQMPLATTQVVYEDSAVYTTSHNSGTYLRDLTDALETMRVGTRVLEIGCNDGAFLAALAERGYAPLCGIEPNHHSREKAQARGIAVEGGFFTHARVAGRPDWQGAHDVVVARHVLEHVGGIADFLAGVHALLRDDGVFLLEIPYVEPGFAAGSPNVLWEEHVNYFTEETAVAALANAGLRAEMKRFYTGGALVMAILARKTGVPAQPHWPAAGRHDAVFGGYAERVATFRRRLAETIAAAKARGALVSLYGAGFRSSTTINSMGVGSLVDEVIDDRADLAGYLMPGTDCPISPLREIAPDGKRRLMLLGVGAEHERKIMKMAEAHFGGGLVPLSLVYPGDMAALCDAAEAQIAQLFAGK